ncbi:MAG TPA: arylesterase [Kiloniellaceae bacterium]|nr:arylesterase [Kiloniellaceae bacterium]
MAFGDSLTHGYGLGPGETFPEQLEAALQADGFDVTVLNAGNSGDTTAGGLARLDWALADDPDAMIVELGANDGLRGLDPAATYANLDAMLTKLKDAGLPVLLAGMLAPPNLGREYGEAFNAVYPRLAEKHDVLLYPFFLDGVAAERALNQGDGIHPNAEGVAEIVARIKPHVVRLLEQESLAARPAAAD